MSREFDYSKISGNPLTEARVILDNDGRASSANIETSSGYPDYDNEVLRAIKVVGKFPTDINGNYPSRTLLLRFSPND